MIDSAIKKARRDGSRKGWGKQEARRRRRRQGHALIRAATGRTCRERLFR